MISTASNPVSFYETLGLNENQCSVNDIKKAYRKMALRWHPDKNPANHDEAVERFEKISQAYQILSLPQAREMYDRLRRSSISASAAAASAAADDENGSLSSTSPSSVGGSDESWDRFIDALRHVIQLNPAQQVFVTFFGGRNPFDDMLAAGTDSDGLLNQNGRWGGYKETPTRRWYPCLDDLSKRPPYDSSSDPFRQQNASSATSCVRHVSTSTRISNGKKIVTRKVVENGIETITVEENGELIKKTVNGSPVTVETAEPSSVLESEIANQT